MPNSQRKYKAGKLYFLLVCLFLYTGCSREKAVFYVGEDEQTTHFVEQSVETEKIEFEKECKEIENFEEIEQDNSQRMININAANVTELMLLPGIGEVRALAIIEYRQNVGAFEKIEDIMNVKGIKTGIFSKINSLICVK